MIDNPLVSVIIPTYKRAHMLPRAIRSVCEQTYSNIEVLVVSDNEPDDEFTRQAREVVESFCDNRVRLIVQQKHINGAVARNVGIKASKGDYITFLDDDDYYDVNKIECQVKQLAQLDDSWGGVCCRYKVYKNGKLVEVSSPFKGGYVYKDIMMRQISTQTNSVMLKRECLFEAGLFDETLLRHQDVQLLVRFTYKYRLWAMDDLLNNLDQDDVTNRMAPDKVVRLKKDFFNSVKDIINSMSSCEQYRLSILTKFDIGALYIIDKQYVRGITYCMFILLSPVALCKAIRKVWTKKAMQRKAVKLSRSGMYEYRPL